MQNKSVLGFTLLEFTVGLFLAAVAGMLSVPLYYKIANNHRATSYTNELVATLHYARVQAVTRARTVSVCSSSDGTRCTNTSWSQGYIVFKEDGEGASDKRVVLLKKHFAAKPGVTITFNGPSRVRYSPIGGIEVAQNSGARVEVVASSWGRWLDRLSPLTSALADESALRAVAASAGVFTVCAGHSGRLVTLSLQGFVSTRATACR